MPGPAERFGTAVRRDSWGRIVDGSAGYGQPSEPSPGPRPGSDDRRQSFTVGRALDCDVRLDDESVSRRHAEVERLSGGRLHVTDCRSTNGTFVLIDGDWRPVRQQMVTSADRVRFGTCVLTGDDLDARCARALISPGRACAGPAAPAGEPAGDSTFESVRDPETGEVIERKRW